jgi:hypothetical protein
VAAIRSGWAIGACPGSFECLASTTFCAIIAIGYSQDLEFRGWAGAGQNDESNDACLIVFCLEFKLALAISNLKIEL